MDKQNLFSQIDNRAEELKSICRQIWEYAETALNETRSSALLRDYLQRAGFRIKEVPGLPTAFIAEYGEGRPVIGILSEYDALPGLSQKVQAEKEKREGTENGHGCGHNMICTSMLGAAVALREAMNGNGLKGTLRYYACPAEEITVGKVEMARQSLFDDLDAVLGWHPSQLNVGARSTYLATNSIKFHFKGKSSHAAAAPEAGRSALDAVELMNVGANYLREHINDKARLHYCITNGGTSPNTVPEDAEVWYIVRAPRRNEVQDITRRLYKIAAGAALMTETKVIPEFQSGCYDVMPNEVLSQVLDENLQAVGAIGFTKQDYAFARELGRDFTEEQRRRVGAALFTEPGQIPKGSYLEAGVYSVSDRGTVKAASTDAGDVSYIAPFAQFNVATWPLGCPPHSWYASAASGSGIGMNAMIFAAKVLAGSLADLFTHPETVERARKEFRESLDGFRYVAPAEEAAANEALTTIV